MKEKYFVALIIALNVALLLYGINALSISYSEAQIFFEGDSLLHYIVTISTQIFGQNDLALRLPFVVLHVLSLILIFKIGKLFLKRKIDRVFSVALYALLPGVNSAALLVNESYVVIFVTLLFIAFYMYGYKILAYSVLLLSFFFDNSFLVLYLCVLAFGIFKKDKILLLLGLLLFIASLYVYGFDTGGKPRGYFLDGLGVYAAIFSPFVFLYFIYSMYRILIKEEKNLLWFISFGALILSLILSLRQRLALEDFAPFVVIAVPLMVKIFFNSYRVRLPLHRKYHNMAFGFVLFTLVLNLGFSFFNKPLYYLVQNPQDHFAYKYHIAKDVAAALKERGISTVQTQDRALALRLQFYGINSGGDKKLYYSNFKQDNLEPIAINYVGKNIETFYISQ